MEKTTNAKINRHTKREVSASPRRRRASRPRPLVQPESFSAWITRFEGETAS